MGILNEYSGRKNCHAYMKFNMDSITACFLFLRVRRNWPLWVFDFSVNLVILDLYGDNFIFEINSWLGLWAWHDNSTSFWYLLTGTRFVVFHVLILPPHQANTWLNRLVLHSALKTSLLEFLLSWEGKWIFYASVENVLPLGSWNSNLEMVNRSILADFI